MRIWNLALVLARRGLVWCPLWVVSVVSLSTFLSTPTVLKWTLWLSFAILALSLSLVWGVAGIFSFGQNAFFGIGGYVFAVTALNVYPDTAETISALAMGALGATLFAALLGYVTFYGRVGDVYLAIVTLSVTLILYTVMSSTAGPEYHVGAAQLGGFNGMPSLPGIAMGNGELGNRALFTFSVCVAGALYMLTRFLVTGRYGQILAGLRENEVRMELLGYDVRFHKLVIFAIGGAIAGVGGALFAAWGTFINPAVFSLPQAALVAIWVMVGGRGSLAGAFVGVAVTQWISDVADKVVAQQTPLLLGIILVAMVLAFPNGLAPALHKTFARARRYLPVTALAPVHSADASEEMMPEISGHRGQLGAYAVGKRFGGSVVLENVSVEFGEHRIHCIVGPNGAGKSTLFGLLTGRHAASEGRVVLNGMDVTHLPVFERARCGLGIKLQVPSIFQGLTVAQNIALALGAPRRFKQSANTQNSILALVGLRDRGETIAAHLSHGARQWLEIGMLVAQNPSVMLFDEPAAGMTQDERRRTIEIIRKLSLNHTIIVVEHDMTFIRALGAPVVMLYAAGVFRQGSFDELARDPEVRSVYLGRRDAAAH